MQHETSATWKNAMWKVRSERKSSSEKGHTKRAKQETSQKWVSKLKKVQHKKCATREEICERKRLKYGRTQHGKRCNMKIVHEMYNMKRLHHEKRSWWKHCDMKKLKHEYSAAWTNCNINMQQGATWNITKKIKHKKVQQYITKKGPISKKCKAEKGAIWKKCNTKKLQHGMNATRKKCYRKWVRHEVTQEKVLHEKSATHRKVQCEKSTIKKKL